MIVNFKLFERTEDYKYLSAEEEDIFSEYIVPEINRYFDEKINKIVVGKFVDSNFNYREVLDCIFDIFFFKKMYSYVRHNMSTNAKTPEIHNSFTKILDNVITDSVVNGSATNVYMRLEDRLVSIYEKSPRLYKNHIEFYGDEISSTIKDRLQYILDSEKYNL